MLVNHAYPALHGLGGALERNGKGVDMEGAGVGLLEPRQNPRQRCLGRRRFRPPPRGFPPPTAEAKLFCSPKFRSRGKNLSIFSRTMLFIRIEALRIEALRIEAP